MYSSGMRTARLLTVFQHVLRMGEGVSSQEGVGGLSAQGGVCTGGSAWGESAQGGVCRSVSDGWGRGVSQHALRQTPPVDRHL